MAVQKMDIIINLKDKASQGMKNVSTRVKEMGTQAAKSGVMMRAMREEIGRISFIQASIAAAAFSYAIVSLGKKVISLGRNFESTMKTVQAWSGVAGKELKGLNDIARKMGATTEFTATEAAESLKFLASAGFTANQMMKALPGTLDLATAGQVDLASASDITTDVLTAFGMEVEELTRVNDAFITTSSSSNTNVLMLGESMKMVAPTASLFGLSVEETSAYLGTLANSAVKGGRAGSGLNMVLLKSVDAAKELGLAAGAPLIEVLKAMRDAQWDATQIGKVFGAENVKTAGILMKSIEFYEKLNQKILDNVGATEKLAKIMRDSLDVDLKTLNSTIEDELLKTFDRYKEDMRKIIQDTTEWIRKNSEMIKQVGMLIIEMTKLLGVLARWTAEDIEFMATWVETWKAMGLASAGMITWTKALTGGTDALEKFKTEEGRLLLQSERLESQIKDLKDQTTGLNALWFFSESKKELADKEEQLKKIKQQLYEIRMAGAITLAPDQKPLIPEVKEKPPPKPEAIVAIVPSDKDLLVRAQASALTHLTFLEATYEEGTKDFEEYWKERRRIMEAGFALELDYLKKAEAAAQPEDKEAVKTAIFAKEQERIRASIALSQERAKAEEERAKAEEDLATKQIELQDILSDLKLRANEDNRMGLDRQFTEEIAALDQRQREEMTKILEMTEFIKSEEEKRAMIKQAQRDQDLEKEKLLADQKKQLLQKQLGFASDMAGGMKSIANDLYEMGGKQNKKMFRMAKAMAMAEAVIRGAQAMIGAMAATPGPAGIAMAAVVGVLAAVQVAKIAQTEMGGSFAEGGIIPGKSRHSKEDNIRINATAGEYMQPVKAVKKYGIGVMEGIRNLKFPKEMFAGFQLPSMARPAYALADGGSVPSVNRRGDSGGGDSGRPINIINVTDPRELDQYLASADGQNAILNVLSSRAESVKRVLR